MYVCTKLKEAYWKSFTVNLEHDFYKLQKQIWKLIRRTRGESNKYKYQKIIIKKWARYCRNLLYGKYILVMDEKEQLDKKTDISSELVTES